MVDSETYLRTSQVADALGVSVSTAKRWIDSGEIEATRTVGKHRMVPRSSVVRFAERRTIAAEKLALGPSGLPAGTFAEGTVELLVESLKAGRSEAARSLIASAHGAAGAAMLGDRLIRPAMDRIGHGWLVGNWDVYQEHRASRIVMAALQQRIAAAPAATAPRPVAVGAAPEGDQYVLPGLLCELTLVDGGWDVHNLGVDLPLRSLASAVRDLRPRLAFLAASHLADPDRFIHEYAYFYEAAFRAGTAIVVGGRALAPDIRPRLVYASCGERLAHLAEFARSVLAAPDP